MRTYLLLATLVLSVLPGTAAAAVTLQAPPSVAAGASFQFTWSGTGDPLDFITLVPVGTAEGTYGVYVYAKEKTVELRAPDEPGDYELRYLSKGSGYPTQARLPMKVTPVTATISVPASVTAGTTFSVTWTGPNNQGDFITIVKVGTPEKAYATYAYTQVGSPLELRAPDEGGSYEVRYLTGQRYYTLIATPIQVLSNAATVTVPAKVTAGATFEVAWTGPNNPSDYVAIYSPGAAVNEYKAYQYTSKGSSLTLRAPDVAGPYEVRYITGQSQSPLAVMAIEVTDAGATITAPAETKGGEPFSFTWTGPDNSGDYVGMTPPGAKEATHHLAYAYTAKGNPGTMTAPLTPGDYELRYETGQSGKILARVPIKVTAPSSQPGTLLVLADESVPPAGAVELILDASGSMLKKHGAKRRIDIARDVLLNIVAHDIPAGTPFAFRAFGHKEKGSCRTDLEIALQPLDVAKASSVIRSVESMNLAKTPIGASLELVAEDLASANGSRAVVLLTDGEETCGGDPGAAIESLRASGMDVRVSIVGFAIDDAELKSQFRYWADLGGGNFFDTDGAESLGASLSAALRTPFDVFDAGGVVIAEGLVGGEPVMVPAGDYTVRTRTIPAWEAQAAVTGGQETRVSVAP